MPASSHVVEPGLSRPGSNAVHAKSEGTVPHREGGGPDELEDTAAEEEVSAELEFPAPDVAAPLLPPPAEDDEGVLPEDGGAALEAPAMEEAWLLPPELDDEPDDEPEDELEELLDAPALDDAPPDEPPVELLDDPVHTHTSYLLPSSRQRWAPVAPVVHAHALESPGTHAVSVLAVHPRGRPITNNHPAFLSPRLIQTVPSAQGLHWPPASVTVPRLRITDMPFVVGRWQES